MQVFGDVDARIDVAIDGERGDAIVLLHGFPLDRSTWDALTPALARAHRVIRPDLRGLGKSAVVPGPYLMETLAADVAAVLDALSLERATIVGHSLGGYVALAFARMFAERVERLALVASRLAADSTDAARNRNELADRAERTASMDEIVAAFLPRFFAAGSLERMPGIAAGVERVMRATDPLGAAAMLRGMALRDAAFDIAPDLAMPVAVVAGAEDAIIPLQEARAAAAAFPRGRLVAIEGAGHMPMLEAPEQLTAAIGELLGEPAFSSRG